MAIKLAIVNRATLVSDAEVALVVQGIQQQVTRDFMPVWGVDAIVSFVAKAEEPDASLWQQVLVDNPDVPDTLGYHETTASGLPIGYTSLKADIDAGVQWSTTLSHETLELLADPFVFSLVSMGDGKYTFLEVCDAVEAQSYSVKVPSGYDVLVSDFVTPAWFGAPRVVDGAYSYLKSVAAPFALAPGGYYAVIEPDGTVNQVTARRHPDYAEHREVPVRWSRRWRRQQRSAA